MVDLNILGLSRIEDAAISWKNSCLIIQGMDDLFVLDINKRNLIANYDLYFSEADGTIY